MMDDFVFSEEDYIFNVDWKCKEKSEFSLILENAWLLKKKKNCFRYELHITKSRILEGEHGFLAQVYSYHLISGELLTFIWMNIFFSIFQLNTDRATNRRMPEIITTVNQPFSPDGFNFTKAKQEEIMFFFSKNDRSDYNGYKFVKLSITC